MYINCCGVYQTSLTKDTPQHQSFHCTTFQLKCKHSIQFNSEAGHQPHVLQLSQLWVPPLGMGSLWNCIYCLRATYLRSINYLRLFFSRGWAESAPE